MMFTSENRRLRQLEYNVKYILCKLKDGGGSGGDGIQTITSTDTSYMKIDNTDPKNPKLDIQANAFWKVGGNPEIQYGDENSKLKNYLGGTYETVLGVVDQQEIQTTLASNDRVKAQQEIVDSLQKQLNDLYAKYDKGEITWEQYLEQSAPISQQLDDAFQTLNTIKLEETSKLKNIPGKRILTITNDEVRVEKPTAHYQNIDSQFITDSVSINTYRFGSYQNGSYKFGYDGEDYIKYINNSVVAKIELNQYRDNEFSANNITVKYNNGTIAFISRAEYGKYISAPYNIGNRFITDKQPVFTNVKNAVGDPTFTKSLVMNDIGEVGVTNASSGVTEFSLISSDAMILKQDATNIDMGFTFKMTKLTNDSSIPTITPSIVMFYSEGAGSNLSYYLNINVEDIFSVTLSGGENNVSLNTTCKLKIPIAELKTWMTQNNYSRCTIGVGISVGSLYHEHIFPLILP